MSRLLTASPQVAIGSAPGSFSCAWCSADGSQLGILAGELDAYTAPLLDDALRNAEADAEMIVLDLRRLDFMDCRGMRVMLQSSERLRRAGRRLVLVRGSRHVDLVFRVTGRSEAVEICDLPPDESVVQLLLRLATNCG